MFGIDVSGWQPANITNSVDADFFVIKVTEGETYVSKSATEQYNFVGNRARVGAYHYARGSRTIDAINEANFFITECDKIGDFDFYVLDYEGDAVGNFVYLSFIDRLSELKPNAKIWFYASSFVMNSAKFVNKTALKSRGVVLWFAEYNNDDAYRIGFLPSVTRCQALTELGADVWQYTSNGRINAYNGRLDFNITLNDNVFSQPNEDKTKQSSGKYINTKFLFTRGNSDKNTVLATQQFLVMLGYSMGVYGCDGKWGEITNGAWSDAFGDTNSVVVSVHNNEL